MKGYFQTTCTIDCITGCQQWGQTAVQHIWSQNKRVGGGGWRRGWMRNQQLGPAVIHTQEGERAMPAGLGSCWTHPWVMMLKYPSGMRVMDSLWHSQPREGWQCSAPADCQGPDPNCVWPLASATPGETEIGGVALPGVKPKREAAHGAHSACCDTMECLCRMVLGSGSSFPLFLTRCWAEGQQDGVWALHGWARSSSAFFDSKQKWLTALIRVGCSNSVWLNCTDIHRLHRSPVTDRRWDKERIWVLPSEWKAAPFPKE